MAQERPQLQIRRYQESDRERAWYLHLLGLSEIGIEAGNSHLDRDFKDIAGTYFNGGDFIVGEYQGEVVATGALKRTDDVTAEIKRMRVDPRVRRMGFGRAILAELEKIARGYGYKLLHLDTSSEWLAANNLYRSFGFREVRRVVLRKYPGEAVFYQKILS